MSFEYLHRKYLEEQIENLLTKRKEHEINGKLNYVEAIDDIIAIIKSELDDEDSSSSIGRV